MLVHWFRDTNGSVTRGLMGEEMRLGYWPTLIVGAVCLAVLDMFIHIETDPRFVLYIHYFAWFAFGHVMEKVHNDRAIR